MTAEEDFDWSHPGLNKQHFITLANLLALRSGGQVEPPFVPDEKPDNDNDEETRDDDSDASNIDTSRPCQISDSAHLNRLKRKFLDCLAELVANEKGGRSVACASMKEGEEEVTVWITRNEGFRASDDAFFENLSLLLGV
ncbi:hypothetical protein AJ80_05815 [Polytolypa hystricis UAMH7299]|uniref:Uncharacterized protein n=1 Tax=Polytolypa hystricis (strain UAMH7299) TaxID=1447883 RepID=A0A2B7Y157_POLH7|nr:hypothetical protein AJ80_05815 [Polytolypa hystricis UAMH7299]